MSGYCYEHVNGEIKFKPQIVVDMAGGPFVYFDSPFVRRWWKPDHDKDRERAYQEMERRARASGDIP